MSPARRLTRVAWGLFFVVLGSAIAIQDLWGRSAYPILAFGIGAILVGLNLAKAAFGARVGKLGLAVGIAALLFGTALFGGVMFPLIPAVLILLGLFVVMKALAKR